MGNFHSYPRSLDIPWNTGSFAEDNTLNQFKDGVINYILNWKPIQKDILDLNHTPPSDTDGHQNIRNLHGPSSGKPRTNSREGSSSGKRALSFDDEAKEAWANATLATLDQRSHGPKKVGNCFKSIEDFPTNNTHVRLLLYIQTIF